MNIDLKTIQHRREQLSKLVTRLKHEDSELANAEATLQRLAKSDIWRAAKTTSIKAFGRLATAPTKAIRAKAPAQQGKARRGKAKERPSARPAVSAGKRANAQGSQRELILSALQKSKAIWMNTAQIIAAVKQAHKVTLPQRSISPLLSNLKNAGVIVRDGRTVAAADRAKKR